MLLRYGLLFLALGLCPSAFAQAPSSPADTTPHAGRSIRVEDGVALELLDWGGGNGRPLVFIAGLGSTAHVFDNFAPKLTDKYHVYGITRRGWGASEKPEPRPENYSATRLGRDVIAVIDSLKLTRPVLVGWSFGGEELGAVASQAPDRVAGLVYLDAAYSYAFYAPGSRPSNLPIDIPAVRRDLDTVNWGSTVAEQRAAIARLLGAGLPTLQSDLRAMDLFLKALPENDNSKTLPDSLDFRIFRTTLEGQEKHAATKTPALAIFAVNQGLPANPNAKDVQRGAVIDANNAMQAAAFEKANPQARVVRIPNSRHNVFTSNEADVLREMNQFIAGLP